MNACSLRAESRLKSEPWRQFQVASILSHVLETGMECVKLSSKIARGKPPEAAGRVSHTRMGWTVERTVFNRLTSFSFLSSDFLLMMVQRSYRFSIYNFTFIFPISNLWWRRIANFSFDFFFQSGRYWKNKNNFKINEKHFDQDEVKTETCFDSSSKK